MLATPTSSFFQYSAGGSSSTATTKRKRLSACGLESTFRPSSPSSSSSSSSSTSPFHHIDAGIGKRIRTGPPVASSASDAHRIRDENVPFSAAFRYSSATSSPRPPTVEEQQAWSSGSSIRLEHTLAPTPSPSQRYPLAKEKQRLVMHHHDDEDDMMMSMSAVPSPLPTPTPTPAVVVAVATTPSERSNATEVRKSNWVRVVTSYGHSFVRADEVDALIREGDCHLLADEACASASASPAEQKTLWDSIEGDVEMDG